jgi:hypothetical protein
MVASLKESDVLSQVMISSYFAIRHCVPGCKRLLLCLCLWRYLLVYYCETAGVVTWQVFSWCWTVR